MQPDSNSDQHRQQQQTDDDVQRRSPSSSLATTDDNENVNDAVDSPTEDDSQQCEVEPKLTYERIENDLTLVVRGDIITSACLHHKFFAIGTNLGRIHIFDHQGNKVDRIEICVHLRAVTSISIDEKGEHLVSSSSDRLVVYGLCNSDQNYVEMPSKSIRCVAIDPNFHRSGSGRRFVIGDDRIVLYERGFITRYNSTTIFAGEGRIRNLSWRAQFIAWASDSSVRIYDVDQRAVITFIKRDYDANIDPSLNPCQFCWRDDRNLLIGWNNSVKVCAIKDRIQRNVESPLKELPRKYVEITSMFSTDFNVLGLAPFGKCLIALSLACTIVSETSQRKISGLDTTSSSDQSSDRRSQGSSSTTGLISSNDSDSYYRPRIHVLETKATEYRESSCDTLLPNENLNVIKIVQGNPTSSTTNQRLINYQLLSLHEDGIYFIICSRDVIVAKPRDDDDHIEWLINHSRLSEATEVAKKCQSNLCRYNVKQVQELYMQQLLDKKQVDAYEEAARLCVEFCGSSQDLWDEYIKRFHSVARLRYLAPHLPRDPARFVLKTHSYDFVLNEFLKYDVESFRAALREFPDYSVQTILDAVIYRLDIEPKNSVLNESLAELYSKMRKFDKAVNIYLESKDSGQVFSLIREHNLLSILREKVERLMQIDADETSRLLVENSEQIPVKDVVRRLERGNSQRYLVCYLHRLLQRDADSCISYHDLMVKLYAQYQPQSLLGFLKLSSSYKLEEALDICKKANLIKEVVFILGRMGNLRVALSYITESLKDIHAAIDFCKEHKDKDLWQSLILHSIDKPKFISALLKNIGTHISDPGELIDRIPHDCEIEGLMPALVKMLQDYQLQISLEQSCRELTQSDCFDLLKKQVTSQTRGITVRDNQVCDHCNQSIFIDDGLGQGVTVVGSNVVQNHTGGVAGSATGANVNSVGNGNGTGTVVTTNNMTNGDVVVFGCHHVYHEECCADTSSLSDSASKLYSCRICMKSNHYDKLFSS